MKRSLALVADLDKGFGRRPTLGEVRAIAEQRKIKLPAGLSDARPYDLRHSFASVGAGGGLSLQIIGRLLGHTQARTTMRYAHLARRSFEGSCGEDHEADCRRREAKGRSRFARQARGRGMTMSEAEILWASAAVSIVEKVGEPNLLPLVALLRSDVPITPAARDMLAALIDPDGEGFLRWRLQLVNTGTKRNNTSKDIKKLLIWHEYNDRMKKGERSEDIVYDLAEKNSCNERTIYNDLKAIENLRSWLSGDE